MTLKVTETPPQTVWTKREQVAQRKQEVDHRAALMNPQRARLWVQVLAARLWRNRERSWSDGDMLPQLDVK